MNNKQLDKLIKETVSEVLNEYINCFRLDEMSQITIMNDRGFITEDDNSWILKTKSWEINNYERFLRIVDETPKKFKGYLTQHGEEEIKNDNWITYTLKGYDVAFALHFLEDGKIDLCNLVNNSELKGIGDLVVSFAKNQGATQMDNFRGFKSKDDPQGNGKLGNLYRRHGYTKQTWHDKFGPSFQPSDPEWRLDKTNTKDGEYPDVEGLELRKHRMKYNNKLRNYRKKFDDRIGSKFNK